MEDCDFVETSSLHGSEISSGSSELDPHKIVDELLELTNEVSSLVGQETVKENVEVPQNQTEEVILTLKEPPDINEILSLDEAAISPTSHNVGVLNAACQQVLKDLEQQLMFMLKKNRSEQEIVQSYLNSKGQSLGGDGTKKSGLKCIGIPYFKDLDGYLPPKNQDVLRKKKNNQFLAIDFIDCPPPWSNSDVNNLLKAVNSLPSTNNIDWMRISVLDMSGKFSASECKAKWIMNVRPGVNRSKWKPMELKSLIKIAEKNGCQNWEIIADELDTRRTGFQCCTQYQSYRAKNGGKWTKEEDETLKSLIQKYKVKDYIPWRKVAWHFEDRSRRQCQERFMYCLGNIKKGYFSTEEDFILAYLATKMNNFGEVAKYLPKRVSTQVRARFEYLIRTSMPEFTKEEDELLTELVSKHGRNWGKISEAFPNRSRLQCRGRWAVVQKDIVLENDAINEADMEVEIETDIRTNNRETDSVLIQYMKPEATKAKAKTGEYKRLLQYLRHGFKFLFGPKCSYPIHLEDFGGIVKKVRSTMTVLSVDPRGLSSYDLDHLSNDCEFEEEDARVLTALKTSAEETKSRYTIIPPNYITLVGLRSLVLRWADIKNWSQFYQPRESVAPPIDPEDRGLCRDAKKLFKSRMKSLFALPLILSNICQDKIQMAPEYKPKVRKTYKPLSKRKKKNHAKLMAQTYRNSLQAQLNKKLEETGKPELVQKCEGEDEATKRGRPKKEKPEKAQPEEESSTPKRKRGRPRKVYGPEEKKPKQS